MAAEAKTAVRCWCGSEQLSGFSDDYLVCETCQTLIARRQPAQKAARVADEDADPYGWSYFTERARSAGQPEIADRARLDLGERCAYWLDATLKYRVPPARTLEIGCGSGALVGLLAAAGYDAVGLDLSPAVTRFARETFDVPVLTGPLEDQRIKAGGFDMIAMLDVVEHLADPTGNLRAASRALAGGGFLLLQTPCFDPRQTHADLEASRAPFLKMLRPDEHLFLWSRSSVASLLGKAGFPSVCFLPAFFPEHDMFLIASRSPLRETDPTERRAALRRSRNGRIIEALIDNANALQSKARALAAASEDQRAKERLIVDLAHSLAAVRADQQAKESLIRRIFAELENVRADQQAKEALIRRISAELANVRADQQAKEVLIRRISAELENVRADQRAKEALIQRIAGEMRSASAAPDR